MWALQGHALYYGRGELADEYFDKLGYTLPYRVNVADFILDLSSADVYTESRWPSPPPPNVSAAAAHVSLRPGTCCQCTMWLWCARC